VTSSSARSRHAASLELPGPPLGVVGQVHVRQEGVQVEPDSASDSGRRCARRPVGDDLAPHDLAGAARDDPPPRDSCCTSATPRPVVEDVP
jgi:hypothetical protein